MASLPRIGVVGTGPWAEDVHLPALASHDRSRLAAIYGRTEPRVRELADAHAALAFTDFDAFLGAVDVVSFAVSPDVQVALASRAAAAGKALLLEKPLATTLAEARRLDEAIERSGVASRVFVTGLFSPSVRDELTAARALAPDRATATFNSAALLPGNRFAASPWRHAGHGPLWDVAPHLVATLVSVLGPARTIAVTRTGQAAYEGEIEHQTGVVSAIRLDLMDEGQPRARQVYDFRGGDRSVVVGPFAHDRIACFQAAIEEVLSGEAPADAPRLDARFGCELTSVIEAGCASADAGGSPQAVPAVEMV